jgi:hypothetical protein
MFTVSRSRPGGDGVTHEGSAGCLGIPDYNERGMDETGGENGRARCEPGRPAYDFPTIFVMARYVPVNRRGTKNQETRMETA